MGFMIATGLCAGCGKFFQFNPERVPSVQGKPICRHCIEEANKYLAAHTTRPPIQVLSGAYGYEEVT